MPIPSFHMGGAKNLTRSEATAIFYRLHTGAFPELQRQMTSTTFSDVSKDHWAYQEIHAAAKAAWIKGYLDGTFRPDTNISRAEAVSLINRMRNRVITVDELKALGVGNPYIDLVETYWAYGGLIEATVKHLATDTLENAVLTDELPSYNGKRR